MWEHDLIKLYKGLAHINPGNYTYSNGWATLMADYAEIMDGDTQIRENAALLKRVAKLESTLKTSFLGFGSDVNQAALGGIGGGLLLLGSIGLGLSRRRAKLAK